MPRWKELPEELDPQVKEFTGQLRRLVDRSGLGIAALSDRTGYSKTSWERYLNGRLLAPKGAIVALAEVTGTNPVHLTTMWELAERAWSRSEMRHDMTMEAIRISQARAALGETGGTPTRERGGRAHKAPGGRPAGADAPAGRPGRPGARGGAHAAPGARRPDGAPRPGPDPARSDASGNDVTFESVRYQGHFGGAVPNGPGTRPGARPGSHPAAANGAIPPGGHRSTGRGGAPQGPAGSGSGTKRRTTMFLAGVVGTLAVIAVAVWATGLGGGDGGAQAKPSPSAKPSKPVLPAGVECSGKDCTGQDPETMGCGGELARTTTTARVGTATVEVRYSKTCGAAWARITQAAGGDRIDIAAPGAAKQASTVEATADTDAYTPMVAVGAAGDAKACATVRATARKSCTE
ncbi:DUF2690 domain-containing protein [Streptomyces uncialis]|uniref:XRE family transcriptional regulator n=1 Tax=Streptomyces uncialis TaxID=1048205 RepID=UPI002E2FF4C4|nr:DUF2690 domain-containing protein [Streptomyces uncialis]